jgi:potassium-transporting ATPase KdpC subunit
VKKHILTACLYTVISAIGLGLIYPAIIMGNSQIAFRDKANGQLIHRNGVAVGSRLIGQQFTQAGFFHGRPSAAGSGYDAAASSGSNLAPTNKVLVDRVNSSIPSNTSTGPVPVDLITTSASGLDPDISPAAAFYQLDRVAKERHIPVAELRALVMQHIQPRQFGLLGEPRVNVLELNLALLDRTENNKKSQ